MKITTRSDVFGLSSTKYLRRNAVLHAGNDLVMMWWLCHLISWWGVGLNTSDLTQRSGLITRITSDLVRCVKILLYCMEYNWPMTLAPMSEESWAQWRKNLIGENKSLNWVEWSIRVVSLDTSNRKYKTLARVEKKSEENYSWLNNYSLSILQMVLLS